MCYTPETTIYEFADLVATTRHEPHIREGQHAFNTLYRERPDLANRVRSTSVDPFNFDERLVKFWEWVTLHWDD